ncbi:MAG TPA: hypothetical protein VF669_15390 [Tepidisphaeraceae bacterium]|jgi:hypothetical protein
MDLQALCDLGQQQLMQTDYLSAEATLEEAERQAWGLQDFDTLSRVLMPLQETRRQRRQRCGEGEVCLDLLAQGPEDHLDGHRVIENYPHGQLLVAGWGSIEPAMKVRALAREHGMYVEAFLGAVYAMGDARVVVIVPNEEVALPDVKPRSVDDLVRRLPPHSLILGENELPKGSRKGSPQTFAEVMAMWERLHAPFLAAADMQVDLVQKIEGYRRTIRVDYACELAHQKASGVAKEILRSRRKHAASA